MERKVLIIGEAGDRPWIEGAASERLWRWFGCSSYEELTKLARLENVYRRYGQKRVEDVTDLGHIMDLEAMCDSGKYKLIFLVGRLAQLKMYKRRFCDESTRYFDWWSKGACPGVTYVGIPHPSGLNRVLNDGGDARTLAFVQEALRKWA